MFSFPRTLLALILALATASSSYSYWPSLNTIHVELSSNSSVQCCNTHNETSDHFIDASGEGSVPKSVGTQHVCPSLNEALRCLQIVGNSTLIYLPNGKYSLFSGKETEIVRMSHITIRGESKDSVNITCPQADGSKNGLSFVESINITMQNFTIFGCSGLQNSTNLNYTLGVPFTYLPYRVSVYMLLCINVSISDVVVNTSKGNGMTLYNVGGSVLLFRCSFIKNNHRSGGGGLLIEFSYCIPGNLSCKNSTSTQVKRNYSSNATYTVTSCTFTDNIAFRGYKGLRKLRNIGKDSFSFGHGGGLSVVMKGNASLNSIVFNHCIITNNIAHMGGGFYVAFHDNAGSNIVLFRNSTFKKNKVYEKDLHVFDVDGGGGGGKIIFDNGENGRASNNSVIIRKGSFLKNLAIVGGGLWVETNLNAVTGSSTVSVESCSFTYNSAYLGSGAYLSSGFNKMTVIMTFIGVTFFENFSKCSETHRNIFLPCSGILYSINIPLSISGSNRFMMNNNASAIEIHEAKIEVLQNSTIQFENNVSPYGSSIALYDCSYVKLAGNTTLVFAHNRAQNYGGAIYAGSCSGGSQPADASSECFLQYYDMTIHPNNWNISLFFNNNSDSTGNNSIFAVSLSACWWPIENQSFIYTDVYHHNNMNKTFCWDPWHYDYSNDCQKEIASGPAFISFKDSNFNIQPGDYIKIPEVRDGAFEVISSVLIIACVQYGPASFAIGSQKQCKKHRDGDLNLYFYSTNERESFHVNSTIRINMKLNKGIPGGFFEPGYEFHFENCSFPFKFSKHRCVYQFDYFCCDHTCEECGIGSTVTPKPQYCVSNASKGNDTVIGHCPLSYNGLPIYSSNRNVVDVIECANGHQGTLCGGCQPHLGVPLNSIYYGCVDCSKSSLPGILLFILLELIPLSVMIIFIIVFNINLTSGGMIGFVFYCQVISLNIPVWVYPAWFMYSQAPHTVLETDVSLNRLTAVPYRIFNLDFLTLYDPKYDFPICITNHMNPMEVIVFSYLIPLYCLFTLLLLMIVLVMYERGVHCAVKMTRPFHKCLARFWSLWKIRPSLMESLASIYILCFTPLAVTSLKLLHFTTWQSLKEEHKSPGKAFFYDAEYDYFGFPHAIFGLLAIFVLIFFCILPATFLLLFPYQFFHRFLSVIKLRHQVLITFGDINTGSFCDGSRKSKDFRSFAGLYLFLRLAIMCFYYLPGQQFLVILYLETVTSFVFGGVIMIFRPFKKTLVNFVNFMVFVQLGILSGICLADNSAIGRTINLAVLIHIPLIFAFFYFVYYTKQKCSRATGCCRKVKLIRIINANIAKVDATNTIAEDRDIGDTETRSDVTADVWPDRLENPSDYDNNPGPALAYYNESNIRLLNASSDMNGKKRNYGSDMN